MASDLRVFEVLIHRVPADAEGAALLQERLRQDGIRADTVELSARVPLDARRGARHSLCFAGSAFSEADMPAAPSQDFDCVFNARDATDGVNNLTRGAPYASLLGRFTHGGRAPINGSELRRRTKASYDAIAEQFTEVWSAFIPGEPIEIFLKHLPRGALVLDAGCGPGHHANFFRQAGFEPVGLDFSRSMLSIAARKHERIPFILGDVLSYPLPRAFFDGVWSAVMLNHVPAENVPLALGKLVTSLKVGGIVGLNFQIGRPSELVSLDRDCRFFEYPADQHGITASLEALGVRILDTHCATTNRNIHALSLEMQFATVVGQKICELVGGARRRR